MSDNERFTLLAVKKTSETITEDNGGIRYLTESDFGGGGGGGGDASAANQDEQTVLLTTLANSSLTSDTPTTVSSLATTQTLIAANANRRSLTIFNNSTAILYVRFGASATQVGAKIPIGAGGYYEMPSPIYTGVISGIWASANGNASIYEGV